MPSLLPESIVVLERGWLSANNILGLDGEAATLIDSGYVTHAEQTVALVGQALAGRRLERLINTHAHSDHIGGNAALKAAFGCEVVVPHGSAASIAEWDEDALLLSPLGQQGARFQHERTLAADDRFAFGGYEWQALAVPGHDMDALAYYCAEKRLLISGDALWENGFGVIFSELLGDPDGMAATRRTIDLLAGLATDVVIPGHGAPFAEFDLAIERAYTRLASFEENVERLARHALKVMLVFALLERRQLPRAELAQFLDGMPFFRSVNDRYLGQPLDDLSNWMARDLIRSCSLRLVDGMLMPA